VVQRGFAWNLGSGAFLVTALNILKLYDACFQRMQMFVDELDASGPHHPKKCWTVPKPGHGFLSGVFTIDSAITQNLTSCFRQTGRS
jgi:hypothetical protein